LIVSGKGIIYLVLIFVFESLLAMVLSIFVYRKNGFRFSSWKFNFRLAKIILSGSGFLMFAAAANYIFARVDQVMIRHFLDEGSVGVYAAALKLVEVWYFIPGIVCASLLPAIINAKKISKEKYLNRLRGLFLFLGVTSFLIAVFLTISSSFIVKLLFGVEYLGSISVLNIYAWASIGMFLSVGFYQYFLAENKLKLLFFFYLFLMIINIVLNLVLIPRIGINGAAWSTLFSYFLGLIIVLMMKK
jgi:O-antigen/teichoic acid export membrane protein